MADQNKAPETPTTPAADAAQGKATTEILKDLSTLEAKTTYGAPVMAPKQLMMNASDVEAKHPDLKLRWVNIKDPQKAAARMLQGYRRLTAEEGGRQLGDEAALFGIPRRQYDAMVEHNRQLHEARLSAHKTEVQNAAEAVARQLRDQYGVKIDAERIFING